MATGYASARPIPLRLSQRIVDALAVALLAAGLLLGETLLVERKFAVFGGGFGAPNTIDTPLEVAALVAPLLAAQALLAGLLWNLHALLHRRGDKLHLLRFNFLAFSGGIGIALLAAKFEVLAYFSDAASFELIRNLGGGSLFDAFLFALSESGLFFLALAGAAIAYWIALRLLRRMPSRAADPLVLPWRLLALPLLLLLPLLLAANREPDARYALSRFNAPAFARMLLDTATDFDRDGYSWFSVRPDLQPFDATRHPFALDIPNNGVDEDGFGGDFTADPAELARPPEIRPALPAKPRHLVLVVLESTRGDVLGRRHAGREVTPVLNAVARGGSVAAGAYSHVGFTTASLRSLFSGRLATEPGGPSLFADLAASGYRIAVFSGQPETFGGISEAVGMQQAADVYFDAETLKDQRALSFAAKGSLFVDGEVLLDRFDRTLGDPAGWTQPTFVYLNLQSAHFPYHHPGMPQLLPGEPLPRSEISAENAGRVEATYLNAVADADRQLGALIARLERLGVWQDTLLVVTADHGEALFDDGVLGHGHVIDRAQTQIPLVLSAPGVAIPDPIGLSDFRALLLRTLGAGNVALPPGGAVFQHIGSVDRPAAIGIVEQGGRWTTLKFETGELWFSDLRQAARLDALPAGSPLRARAERLIRHWERERWLARR